MKAIPEMGFLPWCSWVAQHEGVSQTAQILRPLWTVGFTICMLPVSKDILRGQTWLVSGWAGI